MNTLKKKYKQELLAVIHYGSTVSLPIKHQTDIDVLIVLKKAPQRITDRHQIFAPLDKLVWPVQQKLHSIGYEIEFSPMIKTKKEFSSFSIIYLDMVERSHILTDKIDLAKQVIDKTRRWIRESGAYPIGQGSERHWNLKPDYKRGDVFELGWKTL